MWEARDSSRQEIRLGRCDSAIGRQLWRSSCTTPEHGRKPALWGSRAQYIPVDPSPIPERKRRVLILSEIVSPSRVPVFNALAKHVAVDLHIMFLAETDPQLRRWPGLPGRNRFS